MTFVTLKPVARWQSVYAGKAGISRNFSPSSDPLDMVPVQDKTVISFHLFQEAGNDFPG
jgi:hypothetical protein